MDKYLYLKDESYYNDLYDRFTIEECLWWKKNLMEKELPEYESKKLTQKQQNSLKRQSTKFTIYFIEGELNL